jgi:hypothetical protein
MWPSTNLPDEESPQVRAMLRQTSGVVQAKKMDIGAGNDESWAGRRHSGQGNGISPAEGRLSALENGVAGLGRRRSRPRSRLPGRGRCREPDPTRRSGSMLREPRARPAWNTPSTLVGDDPTGHAGAANLARRADPGPPSSASCTGTEQRAEMPALDGGDGFGFASHSR